MTPRGLAALARFTSEIRRPVYDRDPHVVREALERLNSKTARDLPADVATYLRALPDASANEVARDPGAQGRRARTRSCR
jgi:hypothetical protein